MGGRVRTARLQIVNDCKLDVIGALQDEVRIEVGTRARDAKEILVHDVVCALLLLVGEVQLRWLEKREVVQVQHGIVDGLVEHVPHPVGSEDRHEDGEHVVELPRQLEDHHRARDRPRDACSHGRGTDDRVGARCDLQPALQHHPIEEFAEAAARGGALSAVTTGAPIQGPARHGAWGRPGQRQTGAPAS